MSAPISAAVGSTYNTGFELLVLLTLALGPKGIVAPITECDGLKQSMLMPNSFGYSATYSCIGYDVRSSFQLNTCSTSNPTTTIAAARAEVDFASMITALEAVGGLPSKDMTDVNFNSSTTPSYKFIVRSNDTYCYIYTGDSSVLSIPDRIDLVSCSENHAVGYICATIITTTPADPPAEATTTGALMLAGTYDCGSYAAVTGFGIPAPSVRCASFEGLTVVPNGDSYCAASTHGINPSATRSMVSVANLTEAAALCKQLYDGDYMPTHHIFNTSYPYYNHMSYYMDKKDAPGYCFVYTAMQSLITSGPYGSDVSAALEETTDCIASRGVMCWEKTDNIATTPAPEAGTYDCNSYTEVTGFGTPAPSVRCASFEGLTVAPNGDKYCADSKHGINPSATRSMVSVATLAEAIALCQQLYDGDKLPTHHGFDNAYSFYNHMSYYMDKKDAPGYCFVYKAVQSLLMSGPDGYDVSGAVSEGTDCMVSRGAMCWQKTDSPSPTVPPPSAGTYDCNYYTEVTGFGSPAPYVRCSSFEGLTIASSGDSYCANSKHDINPSATRSMVSVATLTEAKALCQQLSDGDKLPTHHNYNISYPYYNHMSYYMDKKDAPGYCFVYTAVQSLITSGPNGYDVSGAVSEGTDCMVSRGVMCWQKTDDSAPATECGGSHVDGPKGAMYYCVDSYAKSVSEFETYCKSSAPASIPSPTYASASTFADAKSIFAAVSPKLYSLNLTNAGDDVNAGIVTYKIVNSEDYTKQSCFVYIKDLGVTGPDGVGTYKNDGTCEDIGRPICQNYLPSFDDVLKDLGLEGNDTELGDMLGAMDSELDKATVDPSKLMAFASALTTAAGGDDVNTAALDGVLITCSKIFDKAGNISTAQLTSIAKNVAGVVSGAIAAALAPPSANSSNSNFSGQAEDLVRNTEALIDKMGIALSSTLSPSDPPVEIANDLFGMSIAVVNMSSGNGTKMDTGFVNIDLGGEGGSSATVPLQANSFKSDPYAGFAVNNDNFSSAAAPLSMKVIGNPNASVEFKAAAKANVSIPKSNETEVGPKGVMSNYTIQELDSFMKVVISIPGDAKVYTVRCRMGKAPTATDHDVQAHITDELNITLNNLNASLNYNNDTDELAIFVKGRVVGVGVLFTHISTDQVNTTGTRTKRAATGGTTSAAAVYAPRVWNATLKAWVPSSDVEIDPASTGEKIVFKSNFMGSITSGLVIPPNTIDFDEVFNDLAAKTAENPAVLILVCCLAGLYFILLIPIRRMDVRDCKLWEFLPIIQNKPEDSHVYQISISIGKKSSPDFDTDIFCSIYGEKGKTIPLTLDDGKRKNFQPNKPTNLTVTCQENIGSVTHIHIWTKARDERDSLYVEWITVSEPELQSTYTFICNDWISPTNTLCYGHEIFSSDMQEGKNFVSLFKDNTKSKIFDDHLWLSVVKRPSKSNFSRVQRWSMCMSTLYLTMVVNAMWFPISPDKDADQGPTISLGPITLSYRTFFVAIMGSLIVIPPNMFIMFFFRRSRPFVPPSRRRKIRQERESVKALPTNLDDDLKRAEEGTTALEQQRSNSDSEVRAGSVAKLMILETAPPPPHRATVSTEGDGPADAPRPDDKKLYGSDQKTLPPKVVESETLPTTLTAEMEAELKEMEKKNNKPFTLPWFSFVFGYIMCGVCIANGVWWPYLYSIQWGKTLSHEWLATLALSLFQSIIVIQPVKVILLAVIASFFLQDTFGDPEDGSAINTVSDLHGRVKPAESREPPIEPQKTVKDDPVVVYSEAKLYKKLFAKLKGVIVHFLYLGLLFIVVTHNTSTSFYYQNKTVKDTLELRDIGLSKVEDIWPWLKETIFPNIYPSRAYNGDILDPYNQDFMYNIDGLVMGPARMKQNREQDVECDELKKAESTGLLKIYECKPLAETRNWTSKWNETHKGGVIYQPYIYKVIEGADYNGVLSKYSLAGYSITMRKWNWNLIIDQLQSEDWIDKQTRAVFVEFVINNMNVNVFTQVKILIETPVYGGAFASYKVNSFRPYPYRNVWDFIFLIIQCIWFLVLCYIIFKEIRALFKDGLAKYATGPWHWVEVTNATLALLAMAFFVLRSLAVVDAVEFMMNNKNEYVDFDKVMQWDELYSLFIALVLFIAIMQLYQPMDFSKQLNAIKMSLQHTGSTIAWYVMIFAILLLLYSHVMTIVFGSEFGAFVEFFRSFYYLFGMLLGILKYSDLIEADYPMLKVMFAFYMVVGNFILLNLFVSVICEGLAYINENPEEAQFDEQLANYLTNKLTSWWVSLTGSRGKGSQPMAKVRRGGPWNRELELYHSLLPDEEVAPIEEKLALEHQAAVDQKADEAIGAFSQVSESSRLTIEEKKAMTKCTSHSRNEHTVRTAIKTIIWDMVLSNDKMRAYITKRPPPPKQEALKPAVTLPPIQLPAEDVIIETAQEEYHCLNETGGRIGPDGGRIEVMPGTWIVIDKDTFSFPSFVRVQAYTTNLFASHVIQLESEQPLAKPFKCCLPFKDSKRRDYCNVFVQRDDGPWTLSYNSVTCFSDSLKCMCHPKADETKYRIAAKATPRKTISKAGSVLSSKLAAAPAVRTMLDGTINEERDNSRIDNALAEEMASKWQQLTKEKQLVEEDLKTEPYPNDEEFPSSRSNLDLL